MFCPYCGNKTPDKGKFCIHCGANLMELLENEDSELENEDTEAEQEITELEASDIRNIQEEDNREDTNAASPSGNMQTPQRVQYNPQYVVIDIEEPEIPLLNGAKLEQFKEKYSKGNEFIFRLGDNEIRYYDDVVMDINVTHYLQVSSMQLWDRFEAEYKEKVVGINSFFVDGLNIYDQYIRKMLGQLSKLLVSVGVMKYSEINLRGHIPVSDALCNGCTTLINDSKKLITQMLQKTAEESQRQPSGVFVGGGRGFAGGLGGMAAMGVANMASGALNSLMTGIAKSGNQAELKRKVDALYTKDWVINIFFDDWGEVLRNCIGLFIKIYTRECNATYHAYLTDEDYDSIVKNMRRLTDKKLILKNASYLLSGASPLVTFGEELKCVIDRCIDDSTIVNESLVLADFFLIRDDIEAYLLERQKVLMEPYMNLPENNSQDTRKKIDEITLESSRIHYDVGDEIKRLKTKAEKQEKEEEEEAEFIADLKRRMEANLQDAQLVQEAIDKGDFNTVAEMAMNGSIVAEERYIQHYIQRIRDEKNTKLFDAIAKQGGKNRVYDCIIAVCCQGGYGTIKDLDIFKSLLINAARQGCTYAMGYIHHLIIRKNADFRNGSEAKKFSEESLKKLSPYAYYWEGKAYCQGNDEGGSDTIANDYDKAVSCISYAAACGIEGAEKMKIFLEGKSAEEINNKRYGKSNSGGCYITTAVCTSFGKADDCYELTAFRGFRDTYLANTSEGKKLMRQYYVTAPLIVEEIDKSADKDNIYRNIWDTYLAPCLNDIEQREYLSCKNRYIEMVNHLQEKYLKNR